MLVVVGVLLVTGVWNDLDGRTCRSGSTASPRRSERGRPDADQRRRRRRRPGRSRRPPATRAARAGPLGLAAAHLDADRAGAAVPARLAAVPGSLVPQRGVDPARVAQFTAEHPDARAVVRPAVAVRRLLARPGSPRSTCCCSSRWSAACCRAAGRTGRRRARGRRRRRATSARLPVARDARRPTRPPDEVLDAARRRRCAPRRFRVDVGRRRGGGGEGLPARDRQPASSTCRCCCCSSPSRWAPVRLPGHVLVVEGDGFANTRVGLRHLVRRGALRRRASLAPFTVDARRLRRCATSERAAARGAARLPAPPCATPPRRTPSRGAYELRVNHPLDGRRHQGVPARQRLRAGVHGARRAPARSCSPARCRSCRGTATTPRPAW